MELTDDPIDINIGLSQTRGRRRGTPTTSSTSAIAASPISPRRSTRARHGGSTAICEAVGGSGLDMERMVATDEGPASVTIGRRLFGELIARWPDLEAVFCGNDDLALGCLFECDRRGIRVPEDVVARRLQRRRVRRQRLSRRSPRSRRRATRWRAAPRRSCSRSSAARASGRSSAASTSAFASCVRDSTRRITPT